MNFLSPSGYSVLDDEEVELESIEPKTPPNPKLSNPRITSQEEFNDQLQSPDVSIVTSETPCQIFLEMLFPFILAGIGMVLAGLLFDKVQHYEVFENIHELFILVPPLLGLKGNLEMTLASRLSTAANLKILDEWSSLRSIVFGNMALCQCQALVISLLVSIVAILFNWIPDGELELLDVLILCSSSMLTAALASALLGGIMVVVVILSRKFGINPDNVVTPIAASLGDLITLWMLAYISTLLYNQHDDYPWLMPLLIGIMVTLIPFWGLVSYRNKYVSDVLVAGWEPVIAAMVISSGGGFILDMALASNPGVAVFSPVINGVGGNLVAVFSSRISTYLHLNHDKCELPIEFGTGCVKPCFLFCSNDNPQMKAAIIMMCMVIPGQAVFLGVIYAMGSGHQDLTSIFIILYMISSLLQVMVLLHIAWWLVHKVWKSGDDPDSVAIPYLTAFGDLIGIALLTVAFEVLKII